MQNRFIIILLLFFFSGMTALIYEVLWMKELGLLFGNASYAMATTLAAFFLGLTVGGYYWGKRVHQHKNPLTLYGLLELGVAFCAAGYFIILHSYALLYPYLFQWLGNERMVFTLVKFSLALLILFPPAYFMGGTLPVISHYAVRQVNQLGQKFSLLYAVNTLGAVLGVLLAGFLLPGLIGYRLSYLLAILITVAVALAALIVSGSWRQPAVVSPHEQLLQAQVPFDLKLLAFLSGLLMLALQVLWGRMFAQVLQNSVYTFAIILMVFLLCLALGGALANRLMRFKLEPTFTLFYLLTGGALLVATTPFTFLYLTNNLHLIGAMENWNGYFLQVMSTALLIMGPPLLLLGSIFPYLLRLSEKKGVITGVAVGKLAAINTAGAIFGSLLAGFVILDYLGLWSGIRLIAVVYSLTAWLWLEEKKPYISTRRALLPAVILLLLVSVFDTARLPIVKVDPIIDNESLLQVWEGNSGTVAVIRRGEHLKVKFNNYYTLGGTGSYQIEQFQSLLPILLHPDPHSVYILGLGTGITAGASLSLPIKKLLVTELVPEVVTAAEIYFHEYNNQLFYDPRATIIEEDGRNYLRGTRETFDVIIADLFVPWKAGVGNLYSLEHYQSVKQRLNAQGLFMQWLPAYQLSSPEMFIIIRTLLEVFPQVTVWRGDFSALRPVIGLLAQTDTEPLSPLAWAFKKEHARQHKMPLLTYYVGDLNPLRNRFAAYQLNSDDFPLIEFMAPISQRRIKAGQQNWLAGAELVTFMREFQNQESAYLAKFNAETKQLPKAGFHLHHAQILKQQGKLNATQQEIAHFKRLTKLNSSAIPR